MPFWSSGQVEPKRQFRFKVTIAGMPDGAEFYARSVTKPTFTITSTPHKFLNHTFHYPGKVEWNTVTVSLVSYVMMVSLNGVALIHVIKLSDYPQETIISRIKGVVSRRFLLP